MSASQLCINYLDILKVEEIGAR